ncbi:MAG: 2-dehydropantoate 2-reductase [Acidimicrobiales bacterium]|nr:2-dehydropantoate 2-reductase [Acidimicrobiales bacterium]
MGKRIAMVGVGALGGYVGGHLARAGHDITLIDFWPANIDAIRERGLQLDGLSEEERFTVEGVTAMHVSDVQSLACRPPIDIAFISVKSYDTEWATMLIRQYLAPDGYVVSLQNCINEERIAGIVGWGRTVGAIASMISVDMPEAGKVMRTVPKMGGRHTVFRAGEVHGRLSRRIEELVELFSLVDSAKPTTNLWGERWSKLVLNGMANGVSAATGLPMVGVNRDDAVRRFSIQLAGEAVRVGQALGFELEKIGRFEAEQYALAVEGDTAALAAIEESLIPKETTANPRDDIRRPSMAQDVLKGRRTEIEFINGYIAAKGAEIGIAAPSHVKLTELVKRVERGELTPSPALLGGKA